MESNDSHYRQIIEQVRANKRIARLNFKPVQADPLERAEEEGILSFGRAELPKLLEGQKSFALSAYGLPGDIEICTHGVAYSQLGWLEVAGLTVLNMDDVRRFIREFKEQPVLAIDEARNVLHGIKELRGARRWVRINDDFMAIHHKAVYNLKSGDEGGYFKLASGISMKAVQLTGNPLDETYTRGLALDIATKYR